MIPDDVSSIGARLFCWCAIQSVNIGDNVQSIGDDAFGCCYNLSSVKIGDGVKVIGNYAFQECDALNDISIGTRVETIGKSSFYKCSNLETITIPDNVKEIGENAFSGCENLKSATLGLGIREIPESLFKGLSKLEEVTIGNTVRKISKEAFYGCHSLTAINIPESMIEIGQSAFQGCSSLAHVTISPYGMLAVIGYRAFYGSGITSFTIPNKVTKIGDEALYLNALAEVKSYLEDPIEISSNVFSKNTYYNASLIVPKGALKKYKRAETWKNFMWFEEGDYYSTGMGSIKATDKQPVIQYSLDGRKITIGQKGLSIIRSSDGTVKKVIIK